MMKIAGTAAAAATVVFSAAEAETAEQVIAAIKNYEFGQSREPLARVEDLVVQVVDTPGQRRAVAAHLTGLLSSNATHQAKQFACRQLALIGGPENVAGIAKLLNNCKTADMARYALEPIPGEAVDHALLSALAEGPAECRAGIINSLGARGVNDAVRALAEIAAGEDAAQAEAAIAALGRIGTPRVGRALDRLARTAKPEAQEWIQHAQHAVDSGAKS